MKIPFTPFLLIPLALLSACSETTRRAKTETKTTSASIGQAKAAEAPELIEAQFVQPVETPTPVVQVQAPKAPKPVVNAQTLPATADEVAMPAKGTRQFQRYKKFDQYDTNKDGFIDKVELKASMQKWMSSEGFSDAKQAKQVNSGFKRRDADKNGLLTRAEFIK